MDQWSPTYGTVPMEQRVGTGCETDGIGPCPTWVCTNCFHRKTNFQEPNHLQDMLIFIYTLLSSSVKQMASNTFLSRCRELHLGKLFRMIYFVKLLRPSTWNTGCFKDGHECRRHGRWRLSDWSGRLTWWRKCNMHCLRWTLFR